MLRCLMRRYGWERRDPEVATCAWAECYKASVSTSLGFCFWTCCTRGVLRRWKHCGAATHQSWCESCGSQGRESELICFGVIVFCFEGMLFDVKYHAIQLLLPMFSISVSQNSVFSVSDIVSRT